MITHPHTHSLTLLQWKDTGDVVEEVLILEAGLLDDLVQRLQEQTLALGPVVLQQHHHVAQRQVVTVVCEHTELTAAQRGSGLSVALVIHMCVPYACIIHP